MGVPQNFGSLLIAVVIATTAVGARGGILPLAAQDASAVSAAIRQRLTEASGAGDSPLGGGGLWLGPTLLEFYGERGFTAAWVERGRMTARAEEAFLLIGGAGDDGLDSEDYHRTAIARLRVRADESAAGLSAEEAAELDLILSDGYGAFVTHLRGGRANGGSIDPRWLEGRSFPDVRALLGDAVNPNGPPISAAPVRPPHPEYSALLRHLPRLREAEAAGGWGSVPDGSTLHPGESDRRVAMVARRLAASGDLAVPGTRPGPQDYFDPVLETAVRAFQSRHGLDEDGLVGKRTLAALNVPVTERIRQVIVNLERIRWLPDDLGARHIRVLVPAFRVELWEDGAPSLDLRAIVGRTDRPTPALSAAVTRVVFSPYWRVPPNIARLDKLPLIRADPTYLARHAMVVLDMSTGLPVDVSAIDWSTMTGSEFTRRYMIRQEPGPGNALGIAKLDFANPFSVYMHDTPDKALFDRAERAFSSGCIRVDRTLELAEALLAATPGWTRDRIVQAANGGREMIVPLTEPVPIRTIYLTAFVDHRGRLNFRDDLYGLDSRVWTGLRERGADSTPDDSSPPAESVTTCSPP
jgi:murein L,D-transpeptidase YcbB/YkuD